MQGTLDSNEAKETSDKDSNEAKETSDKDSDEAKENDENSNVGEENVTTEA